ncbi:MAG: hypothetical protein AMXMBFR34_52360 [Myxococcaceae bacterium]
MTFGTAREEPGGRLTPGLLFLRPIPPALSHEAPVTPSRPWLTAPLTPRFALGSTLTLFAGHLALWLHALAKRQESFGALLLHWDGGHYVSIARDGYSGDLWVFYPAWPMLLRGVSFVLRFVDVPVVGCFLSLALFLVFCVGCALAARTAVPEGLAPRTRLGWLFFLLGPASYVFHSVHTESLFLLLSFGAFFFASTKRPVLAGLCAAACCLTRNQGVFVGVSAALLAFTVEPQRRLRAAFVTGGLALAGVGGFLLFQHLASGSAFTFLGAQRAWAHVDSPLGALQTLVFGNEWQSTDAQNVLRHVAWWLFLGGSAWLTRRTPALGLYALLCFLVQLPQGELVNTFRFAAPVFPLFFFAGDEASRRPRWLAAAALLVLLAVNLDTARRYAHALWAY